MKALFVEFAPEAYRFLSDLGIIFTQNSESGEDIFRCNGVQVYRGDYIVLYPDGFKVAWGIIRARHFDLFWKEDETITVKPAWHFTGASTSLH